MSLSKKKTLTGGSLVLLAIVFIALIIVVNFLFRGLRVDLTENDLYTLSDGTENILASIEEPVNLYFYFSEDLAREINALSFLNYAVRVREMLEEFQLEAGPDIRLHVIDPKPFSEAEDDAAAAGLQAIPTGLEGENLFFGLVGTNSVDDQEVISIFDPRREGFLEYDLAHLVHTLMVTDKPIVGVLSGLQMDGGFDPATRRMSQPWVVMQQTRQLFEVRNVAPATTNIDPEIDLLLLVHPKELSEDTLYAVDQFVMQGGRLLVFVDPLAQADVSQDIQDPQQAMFASKSSDLAPLFDAWGIRYSPDDVVLDATYGYRIGGGVGRNALTHVGILSMPIDGMNQDDPAVANLSQLNLALAGTLNAAEESELKIEPLLTSSVDSQTKSGQELRFIGDPNRLLNEFSATPEQYVLAARFSGKVKSAFPERADSTDSHISETLEAHLVVVADVDMLSDRTWVEVQNFLGQQLVSAFADNGDFVMNLLENLTGSSDLISVRGRATSQRPFLKVRELEREAQERFLATEQQLEEELRQTETKLSELQSGRTEAGALILSPEQQAELERFRTEQVNIRKELRQVRANLREDKERLGSWLKAINIGLIPLVLVVIALVAARRRGASA